MQYFTLARVVGGVLVTLSLLITGCGDQTPPPTPTDYTRYSDADEYFSLAFPDDWKASQGEMGTALLGQAPKTSQSDVFLENTNVFIETIPSGVGLDEFAKKSLQQQQQLMTDFNVIDRQRVQL